MNDPARWHKRIDRRGFLRSAAAMTAATIPGRYASSLRRWSRGVAGLLAPRPTHHAARGPPVDRDLPVRAGSLTWIRSTTSPS